MKVLNTIEEINLVKAPALIKFGQPGCIPCQMTEDILVGFEEEFKDVAFYSCSNVDVVIELGIQHTPFIKVLTNDGEASLSDVSVMMDRDALKSWLNEQFSNNNK